MPDELLAKLDRLSDETGIPRSGLCARLLAAAVACVEAEGRLVLPVRFNIAGHDAPPPAPAARSVRPRA